MPGLALPVHSSPSLVLNDDIQGLLHVRLRDRGICSWSVHINQENPAEILKRAAINRRDQQGNGKGGLVMTKLIRLSCRASAAAAAAAARSLAT